MTMKKNPVTSKLGSGAVLNNAIQGVAPSLTGIPGKVLGKGLGAMDWLFSSAIGNAALGGMEAVGNIGEVLKPMRALKGPKPSPGIQGIDSLNKLSSDRRAPMNLKDLLVQKIKNTKTASVKEAAAQLPFTVTNDDVAFINKFASKSWEKRANFLTEAAGMLTPALMTTSLLGASGYMAGGVYDKLEEMSKRHNAYNQMFEEFPQLKETPREQVDKYWNVLMDYAPKMTINPLVAGQFIENMLNYGVTGVDHNTASQLMQAENQGRQSTGTSDFSKLIGGFGAKAFDQSANAMGFMDGNMGGR
jgi:hypothetical protein